MTDKERDKVIRYLLNAYVDTGREYVRPDEQIRNVLRSGLREEGVSEKAVEEVVQIGIGLWEDL
jgi:hypothetical protein